MKVILILFKFFNQIYLGMSIPVGYQPTTPVSGNKRKYSDSASDTSNNDNAYDPLSASWNSNAERRWENRSGLSYQPNRKNGGENGKNGNWKRGGGNGNQKFIFLIKKKE